MVKKLLALEAFKVGSKVWVLTIGVLEGNPEGDSIRAQRERARSALFSQVVSICHYYHCQMGGGKDKVSCVVKLRIFISSIV